MLSVPRVTMNGGSRANVINAPLRNPKPMVASIPQVTARAVLIPWSTAALVMTIEPSAITIPHDRSMPAVRTTSVWPMAITPTTTICCRISEKFWLVKNRSDWDAKNAQASSRARSGPDAVRTPPRSRGRPAKPFIGAPGRLLAPARTHAERRVPAVHAFHRRVGDQGHAGIDRAGHFLAGPGVLDGRLDAERRHPQRILLRRGRDDSGPGVAHAGAPAVDRHDQDVLVPPGCPERPMGARRGGLVDGVDEIDIARPLQAVLHRRLCLRLIALGVGAAHEAGISLLDAVTLQEAVMPQF